MYPTTNVDELRRRLGVDSSTPDTLLQTCLNVATVPIDQRCDPTLALAYPDNYREGVYQLAVKVWDTGSRGLSGADVDGFMQAPTFQATAGMVRSVYGVIGPCMPTGGAVFA